ncbi:hypothetical protein ACFE04_015756 [Oxalis oulophora]
MASEPPPFQEAPRCDVCKCSFNTFRRRLNVIILLVSFNNHAYLILIYSIIAGVVAGRYATIIRPIKWLCPNLAFPHRLGFALIASTTPLVSRLDVGSGSKNDSNVENKPALSTPECKCGMPLCICEAPAPLPKAAPVQLENTSSRPVQENPKPKKADAVPKNRASASSSKPSSVFNFGQVTNGTESTSQMDYEVNGEGMREAIKNGDFAAVKKLLSEGVDANYHDKQGMSLLHLVVLSEVTGFVQFLNILAALFNRTEIAFSLMQSGANVEFKNAQGETPLDCAPATLQYKMRQKLNEGRNT